MLRHSGKAALEVGKTVHHVCHFVLTIAVVLSIAAVGGAWRLSRGPVNLGFLKKRIEAAVNSSIAPARMSIGGVSVAWGGFRHGLDQPIMLRVTDLTIDDSLLEKPAGIAGQTPRAAGIRIPLAEAALSARWMLIGRVLPRTITLDGARLVLVRKADGSVSFDIGDAGEDVGPSPLRGLLAAIGAPVQTDLQDGDSRFSQLSGVSIHGGTLLLDDRETGVTWTAERADIDLTRHKGGGMDGQVALALTLGGQKAALNGKFNLAPAARSVHVAADLSRVTPKALAEAAPVLAPLAALDMPMSVSGEADFGPDLAPKHLRLTAQAGSGKINTGGGSIPVRSAKFTVAGTPELATIENASVELQPSPGAPVSTVGATGQLTRQAGRLDANLHLSLDHVGFADLPALWPADFSPPTRTWISENITTGTARDGMADLVLEKSGDAPDVTLVSATGTLEGQDIAVSWLPTVPRVEQISAHLVLTDPDNIEIDVRSGRQKVSGADPILVQSGHVSITGLSQHHQVATVRCEAAGSLPSAIALLKEPRLRLLDRHPIDLRAPSGDARISLHVVVPLDDDVQIDDVTIHATGSLTKVHLTGIAVGQDLDNGTFALDVDTNQMSLKGPAKLGGIPANIDAMMDFRAGPPSQVLQRFAVTGRATAQALSGLGLDTEDALKGEIGLNVVASEYRDGDGEISADADLTQSELMIAPLGWRKPQGIAAKASARINLTKDKLTGIDRLAIDGAGIQVRGAATAFGGRLDTIRLDRVALGRTDVRGTLRLAQDGPLGLDVSGPLLDISEKLLEKSPKKDPAEPEPPAGPPWSMRGRFDRILLAHDQTANRVAVTAENDGRVFRGLAVTGMSGSDAPFSARISQSPTANGRAARRLAIDLKDAGTLLRGLDITASIEGGQLSVAGDFDDSTSDHTLSGTLDLRDFRVIGAPALGKLLQAVTLYGLGDALGGPGLSFSQLNAPFEVDDDRLILSDARAFSSSLGLTAKGWLDRTTGRLNLDGTLVPAYVINSALGRIPLVGGLFSAEKGGGLFAINYSLRGPTENPTVVVNPFSALTPGILRGMFGMFDQAPPSRPGANGNVRKP